MPKIRMIVEQTVEFHVILDVTEDEFSTLDGPNGDDRYELFDRLEKQAIDAESEDLEDDYIVLNRESSWMVEQL